MARIVLILIALLSFLASCDEEGGPKGPTFLYRTEAEVSGEFDLTYSAGSYIATFENEFRGEQYEQLSISSRFNTDDTEYVLIILVLFYQAKADTGSYSFVYDLDGSDLKRDFAYATLYAKSGNKQYAYVAQDSKIELKEVSAFGAIANFEFNALDSASSKSIKVSNGKIVMQ